MGMVLTNYMEGERNQEQRIREECLSESSEYSF
jgi:hypothetical protein